MASKFDIEKIRKKMAQKADGRKVDPFEFRPAKAKAGEAVKYRCYVLPDVNKGDKVYGGVASRDMDLFVLKHGQHWINKRPHACPRLFSEEECDMCQIGFDALKEIPKEQKEARTAIIKQWLASSVFAANLYFPPIDPNPEEIRGKVLWFNAPKQIFDIWFAAVNRNDLGDADDPEAFGVFYDPYNAFMFQLVAKQKGDYNEYTTSKFIAAAGSHPIVQLPSSKKPDEDAIQKILDMRHDLYTKIETPNPAAIAALAQSIMNGGDATPAAGEIPATTVEDIERKAEAAKAKLPPIPDDEPAALPKTKVNKPKPEALAAAAAAAAASAGDLADEVPVATAKKATPAAAPTAKKATAPAAAPVAKAAPKAAPKPAADDDDDDDGDINSILAGLKKGEDDDDDTAAPAPDDE